MGSNHPAWKPGPRIADMESAEVIQRPLHAVLIGEGPPLVLVHGLLVSGEMFAPVVPDLARRHRLVIPDLRGQGASASLPGPYTPGRLTIDLAALLEDLGLSRVPVLGYSQGGPIALQLLHDHPDLVGRLILACTYAFNMATIEERLEGHLMPWMLLAFGPRTFGNVAKFANVTGGRRLTPEQADWLTRQMTETPRRTAAHLARGAMAFDGRPWLQGVGVPALIVAGAEDRAVPLHHAAMLARDIARA